MNKVSIYHLLVLLTFSLSTLSFIPSRSNSPLSPLINTYRRPFSRSASIDNLRESLAVPKDNICRAVDQTKSKKLSVSDAASLAGCDLREARNGLVLLATLTGADLDVTNDGEIVYKFPENYRQILQKRSTGQQLKTLYSTVKAPLFSLIRISFGLFLIASLIIIGTSLAFISVNSSSNSDDREDRRGRSSPMFSYNFFGPSPFDLIIYGQPPRRVESSEISFLESFFSYIFGDGNPNTDFSSEQLRACAKMIRSCGGVAVAEQLAPFLDPPDIPLNQREGSDSEVDSALVREQWVLPAVVQLNGVPSVTEEGDIVYTFPDLMMTAQEGDEERNGRDSRAPSFLQEKIVPFSRANPGQLLMAGGLGVVNLIGALSLGRMLGSPLVLTRYPELALVGKLFPVLLGYAVLYNIIPVVRGFLQEKQNNEIASRNKRRQNWAMFLQSKNVMIARKLAAAAEARRKESLSMRSVTDKDVFYSTSEPESRGEERLLDDFDQRLKRE